MIDFVFVAMFAVILVLAVSIYLVKVAKQFNVHKWIQIALAVILLIAVAAFEVDVQFFTDWKALAAPSQVGMPTIKGLLWIHLFFAVPTPFLWVAVIWLGLSRFPSPPVPGKHSETHRKLGWIAAIGMLMTAITGWVFYYAAFVA